MKIKDIMPIIYDNFEVFHIMCLSATLISTYNCIQSDADSHKVITFIGEAFKIPQEWFNPKIYSLANDNNIDISNYDEQPFAIFLIT